MVGYSFYDWCIKTDNEHLLDLWDYDLNEVTPKDIASGSHHKFYFKCPRGLHDSELRCIEVITRNNRRVDLCCSKCNSFGQWCLDNDRQDLLDRWDYELNIISPFDVSRGTNNKYFFKCPVLNPNHKSEEKSLSNIISKPNSSDCIACKSFAQWGIDNICEDFLDKYWSDKNTIDPYTISCASTTKVWIKCQEKDYHEDYQISAYHFKYGKRCPYCSGKKVNYFDSLGYKFPLSVKMWSDKNEKSPYDYLCNSGIKVWFHCDIHGDYQQIIASYYRNEGICPKCSRDNNKSRLQAKVEKYIKNDLNYQYNNEQFCSIVPINPRTGSHLFFDIEVIDLNLIIEVNGMQHYQITTFTKLYAKTHNLTDEESLEYQIWKDEYKKEYALSHGYNYLAIPYWTEDKNQSYRTLIDEKISEIMNNSISTVTTTGDNGQPLP